MLFWLSIGKVHVIFFPPLRDLKNFRKLNQIWSDFRVWPSCSLVSLYKFLQFCLDLPCPIFADSLKQILQFGFEALLHALCFPFEFIAPAECLNYLFDFLCGDLLLRFSILFLKVVENLQSSVNLVRVVEVSPLQSFPEVVPFDLQLALRQYFL